MNELRATLGVRPTPFPVAGAVAGTLHVTGPLEKPVFSGTAVAVRPGREMLADAEATAALAALAAEPGAVGAYDRVPFASAGAVFRQAWEGGWWAVAGGSLRASLQDSRAEYEGTTVDSLYLMPSLCSTLSTLLICSLDTKAETLTLHAMYAEPVGGGRVSKRLGF